MRRLISLLAVGGLITFLLIMIIALAVQSYSVLSSQFGVQSSQFGVNSELGTPNPELGTPTIAVNQDLSVDLAEIEAIGQTRRAIYTEQQATLQATIQERRATYQSQIAEAQRQLTLYQAAIEQYQQDTHTLDEQISQLEQALTEREANYQTQVKQAIQPFQDHRNQLLAQREAARQALSATRAQLGR